MSVAAVLDDELVCARTDLGLDDGPAWWFEYLDERATRKQMVGWGLAFLMLLLGSVLAMTVGARGPAFVRVQQMQAAPLSVDPRAVPLLVARDNGGASRLAAGPVGGLDLVVGRYAAVPSEAGRACYWEVRGQEDGFQTRRAGWITGIGWVEVTAADTMLRSSDCFWALTAS